MTNVNEVAPPGWGHTKAEKEKTKPNKPKSKIGGSAHEFDKDLKSGKFKGLPGDKTMKDKKASMFKLMWSMKNKGDKPHYKPGVKDVLKKKYQKEEKVDEKPYPPTRLFKNVPNSVVKKANKEADKVKREQEKAVLGEPPVRGPSGDSMHSKDNVYEDSLIAQAIAELSKKTLGSYAQKAGRDIATTAATKTSHPDDTVRQYRHMEKRKKGIAKAGAKLGVSKEDFGLPPATVADKDLGDKINKAHDKEQKRRAKIDDKNIKVHGKLPYKKEDMSLAPKGKGRKAAKALYKEGEIDELSRQTMVSYSKKAGQDMAATAMKADKGKTAWERHKSSTKKMQHLDKRRKGIGKVADKLAQGPRPHRRGTSEEVTHFGDILRQAIAEAKKVDAIKEINKIVKTKTMGKLHGQKVDLFTASAIQQVYKAINHKNKEKMNSVMSKDIHGLLKMADFSMSKMKR